MQPPGKIDLTKRLLGLFALIVGLCAPVAQAETEQDRLSNESFEREITKTVSASYLLYLPEGYEDDKAKEWPMMIFLHGSGERGNDLAKVARHGPLKHVRDGKEFPMIIVAPQCPHGHSWEVETLNAFYDDMIEKYRVDPNRVYLTGLSLGGHGTWTWAANNPERFAAIAPVCGWGPDVDYQVLSDMPIWAFHGSEDQAVKLERGQKAITAVSESGGNPEFTVYEGVGHNSWDPAYNNDALYDWMLSHSLKERMQENVEEATEE
ncbi:dienelactone hydrolase family protein [Cerasicoccus fimbriatus]|uniref:carboxylesterase family protein n=1 Tax=Cerasicoccus fimbriatus TaxID=3014554 RepID=UPI0022B2DAA8|nr:dienelactone hydrolase family protein [Cerasicoccus sp. TK19100]